jgi:hypothetical protein
LESKKRVRTNRRRVEEAKYEENRLGAKEWEIEGHEEEENNAKKGKNKGVAKE